MTPYCEIDITAMTVPQAVARLATLLPETGEDA
jgi:hypothetical protein